MEKSSTYSLTLAEPFGFLFLHIILNWVLTLRNLSLRFLSFFLTCSSIACDEQRAMNAVSKAGGDSGISREDVEMVMGRMGLYCRQEGEQLKECIGLHELGGMFEDKEPSLEEVKEAFRVFDESEDGFIDAVELQSVLSKLGFTEGLALDACKQMIAVYDENRDGLIDFNEFVKFMGSSFC